MEAVGRWRRSLKWAKRFLCWSVTLEPHAITCVKSLSYAIIVGVFSDAVFPAPGQRLRTSICSATLALSETS